MSFKSELHDLMIKHNISSISFTADSCSDWHGMYDTRMVIYDNNDKVVLEVDGENICKSDLKDDE